MSATPKVRGKPVIVIKEGASNKKGSQTQINSIMAARAVAETIKSSLGPKGMDKMLINKFSDIIVTNDGRTILEQMEIQHPSAKMMVDVAKTQDNEVGDGTTSSVIVAGELLSKAEDLINKGVHPTVIVDGFEKAAEKALETLEKIAIPVSIDNKEELKKIAATSMASKIVSSHKEALAEIVVLAALYLKREVNGKKFVDLNDLIVEKKLGESLASTMLVKGVILKKEVLHPAMPKRVEKAKIALIDSPLDILKTEYDSKIHFENPEQMEAFIKQEEEILGKMVDKIASTGANVLILQEDLNKLCYYLLAKKGILAVRRLKQSIMKKVAKATGATIVSNVDILTSKDLGYAELVEERSIVGDKLIFIENCKDPHSVALLLRGANKRVVDEAERSIHDALCVVRDVILEPKIVAGGGAPEIEVAKEIKKYALTLQGKEQLAAIAYAEALEIIPTILTENSGLNAFDILPELRSRHDKGELWSGVNVLEGKISDMDTINVIEPLSVKNQIIKSATDAATMILNVDDIVSTKKIIKQVEAKPEKKRKGLSKEDLENLPI